MTGIYDIRTKDVEVHEFEETKLSLGLRITEARASLKCLETYVTKQYSTPGTSDISGHFSPTC